MGLIRENWRIGAPIRALTVGVTKLVPKDQVVEQMSLFDCLPSQTFTWQGMDKRGAVNREKQERLETLVDELRGKHGEGSITLGFHENKEIGLER